MEHERFELQNVANPSEMAASSAKMLQMARKTGRKKIFKKNKTEQHNSWILDPLKFKDPGFINVLKVWPSQKMCKKF